MDSELFEKFLTWLYKNHNITKDWVPNRTSIELWEEFRKEGTHVDTRQL